MSKRHQFISKFLIIGTSVLTIARANYSGCTFKSGFYIGPQLSGDFLHTNFETTLKVPGFNAYETTSDKHISTLLYGVTFGFRHVFPTNFVLGGNVDVDFNRKTIKRKFDFDPVNSGIVNTELKRTMIISPTITLGHVVHPQWMVFTQLGAALGRYQLKSAYSTTTMQETSHKKRENVAGFIAGIGTEYGLSRQVSVKGSVNYQILKTMRIKFSGILNNDNNDFENIRISNKSVLIKLAAIYKL